MPEILHKGVCTRKTEVGEAEFSELWKSLSAFRLKMEPIRKWQADEDEKTRRDSDILEGMNKIEEAQNVSTAAMIETLKASNRGTTK